MGAKGWMGRGGGAVSTVCNVQARREQNQGNGRWGGKTHGTRYGKVTNVTDGEAGRVKWKLPSPPQSCNSRVAKTQKFHFPSALFPLQQNGQDLHFLYKQLKSACISVSYVTPYDWTEISAIPPRVGKDHRCPAGVTPCGLRL